MTTRKQLLVFAFLCGVSLVLWWRPLTGTLRLAFTTDAYTHLLLILPLSSALIYFERKAAPMNLEPNQRSGATLLIIAAVIGCYARFVTVATPDIRLAVGIFALVSWWLAGILFCFGAKPLQTFVFPLGFLFLLVPIPAFVVNWIIEFLHQRSALAARLIFRIAGVPVTQDGIMLSIPGLDLEVAYECSSIRSSLMLLVSTMVLAHLFLRSSWRKVLLVAFVVPLSVVKNGIRIFVIAELGTRVDRSFLDGDLHHHGGIVFFGLAVAVVGILTLVMRYTEMRPAR